MSFWYFLMAPTTFTAKASSLGVNAIKDHITEAVESRAHLQAFEDSKMSVRCGVLLGE